MRPLRALVIYIAVVFIGGALLAPWFYWVAQAGAQTFPNLGVAPFHRFVHRSLLLLALAGLWPLLRALDVRSFADVGLVKPAGQWKKLLAGLALGFLSLALVAAVALAGGGRTWHEHLLASSLIRKLFGAAITAIVVAVLEEILFRGGIFGALRRVGDWRVALVVSSMIYAIVHFFARTEYPGIVNWASGFGQLRLMLGGFTDWQQIVPGFFSLTLAGAMLALAFHRTGNLYFSIGLHAGWIFTLKSYRALTVDAPHANVWLYGTEELIDGWLALAVLSLALVVFTRLPMGRQTNRTT